MSMKRDHWSVVVAVVGVDEVRLARMALLSSSISLSSAKANKCIGDKEPVGLPRPTLASEMVGVLNNDEDDRKGGGGVAPMGMSGPKSNRSLKSNCCPP